MMHCDVCGAKVRLPIELRVWDDELDETLEADVCSGDCAKAWIDGVTAAVPKSDGEPPDETPPFAEGDEVTHPGWARDIAAADGETITYTAHAATDPATVAALDALARAAYAQFGAAQPPAPAESEGQP